MVRAEIRQMAAQLEELNFVREIRPGFYRFRDDCPMVAAAYFAAQRGLRLTLNYVEGCVETTEEPLLARAERLYVVGED